MFFSQDILQKRGGKFGKIWLAATKMSKLSRREVASISICRSCDEILEYIERRVVPREMGGARPRLSLYLSALLMYGCVRIHQKQLEYLLADASTMFVRVTSVTNVRKGSEIDLKTEIRADLVTIPEAHMLTSEEQLDLDLDFHFLTDEELSELLGRPNPEFWRMETSSASLSPRPLSVSTLPGSPKGPMSVIPDVSSPHTVKSIENITIKDNPPMLLSPWIPRPWEKDLPNLDGREQEFMHGQQLDEPGLSVADLLPTSTPLPAQQDRTRRNRTRQQTVQSPIPVISEQAAGERTPPRHPPREIPDPRAVPPSPGVTIITSPLPRRRARPERPERPELELTVQTPSPARRRRKRQLAFADAETQIPKSMMKKNLSTGSDTCENFVLQELGPRSASDLLNLPGRSEWRREPFVALFRTNTVTRAVSDTESLVSEMSDLQSPTQDQTIPDMAVQPILPELGAQAETLPQVPVSPVLPAPEPAKRRRRRATVDESIEMRKITSIAEESGEGIGLQSMELGRDLSTSNLGVAEIRDLSIDLEDSRQERNEGSTRKKRKTRSTASSVEEDQELTSVSSLQASRVHGPLESRSLYDIHEELDPRVPAIDARPPLLPKTALGEALEDRSKAAETLLRSINDEAARGHGRVMFHKICPPQTENRRTAAKVFAALLGILA